MPQLSRDVSHELTREGNSCTNELALQWQVCLKQMLFFFFVHLFFPLFSFLFEWNTNYFIHTHTQEKEREGRNEHLDLIELKNMHIRNTLRPDSIPISVLSWLPTSYLDNHYSELGIYQGLVSLLDLYKAHFPKFSFSCFLTW